MLNPGDRFGDYTVVRLLGQGGMGAVFLLESVNGGQVAAKILDPASSGDHESRKRFLREAELALGVKHPNLVETYDVGEDPDTGLCYILMEYVSGGSLADRLDGGPLPINDAIRIVYQIASVLELAREKGIVHRDIKPANIMFGADGQAKLADLGIARGKHGTETTTVTQTGVMIGTPAYMSPEQMLNSHNVDCRADIYSLGIVFYEMLTGERPNKDDTVVQLMAKAMNGVPIPDVRKMRPEVSASIAELISLMCAMKADDRVSTPVEVTRAIALIVHGRKVLLRRKRSRKRWLFAGLGAFAAAVVAAAVIALASGKSDKPKPAVTSPKPPAASKPDKAKPVAKQGAVAPKVESKQVPKPDADKTATSDDCPIEVGRATTKRPDDIVFGLDDGERFQFVGCPAGVFTAGNADWKDAGERASDWERPAKIRITRPFWLMKCPVTCRQWQSLTGEDRVRGQGPWNKYRNVDPEKIIACREALGGDATAVNVCRGDVSLFIELLNARFAARLPKGQVFRLPTAAEFEYALYANSSDPNDPYSRACRRENSDSRWKVGMTAEGKEAQVGKSPAYFGLANENERWLLFQILHARVGMRKPNAWGLHDMMFGRHLVLDSFTVDSSWPWVRIAPYFRKELRSESRYDRDDPVLVPQFGRGKCGYFNTSFEARKGWWSLSLQCQTSVNDFFGCFRLAIGPDLVKERASLVVGEGKPSSTGTAREEKPATVKPSPAPASASAPAPAAAPVPEKIEVTPAGHATSERPRGISFDIGDGDKLVFTGCPAGTFTAGSVTNNNDELPDCCRLRKVTISRPFWLMTLPITYGQWQTLAGENPIGQVDSWYAQRGYEEEIVRYRQALGGSLCPAIVSYRAARMLAARLNERFASSLPKGCVFRLPTSMEWEYALYANSDDLADPYCRIRSGRIPQEIYARIAVPSWEKYEKLRREFPALPEKAEDSFYQIHGLLGCVSGRKLPNAWDLYDMVGNCHELVLDAFAIPESSVGQEGSRSALTNALASSDYGEIDPLLAHRNPQRAILRGTFSSNKRAAHVSYQGLDAFAGSVRLAIGPDLLKERGFEPVAKEMEAEQEKPFVGKSKVKQGKPIKFKMGGKVEMELVNCPAGKFTMGYEDGERRSLEPHEVTITRPFWIGKYPVTVEQWERMDGKCGLKDFERTFGHRKLAVGDVSYPEACDFCERLTKKYRRHLPKGYVFRLPTEAEWEYACKAQSDNPRDPYVTLYSKDRGFRRENIGVMDVERKAFARRNGFAADLEMVRSSMWPVGTKTPNAWGVFDMIGLNREFVLDTFPVKDPQTGTSRKSWQQAADYGCDWEFVDPVSIGSQDFACVIRSSDEDAMSVDSARKIWILPTTIHRKNGFRVVAGPDLLKERQKKGRSSRR